jgi:carbamoyltransferase
VVNKGNLFFSSALDGISKLLPERWDRKDLSASIQQHAEDLVRRYVGYWQQKTRKRDIALAGGLFANVKINQRVHELTGVQSVHVHPGMTDEGLAVGAALALSHDLAKDRRSLPRRCFEHVYLGPSYSDEAMEKALTQAGIPYQRSHQVEEDIVDLLTQGFVVARFHGAMEYGPRALGNRSILYKPSDPSVNDWLNKRLKRTEFMPFAPSLLAEEASKCFHGLEGAEDAARFMTVTFDCTPWMTRNCAGVVHVDGTARPQLVSERDNPSYYQIIRSYHRRTGLPTVVNTSFNIHEEPIVCSPQDAIRAFQLGHLDILALGHFLAHNPETLRSRPAGRESEVPSRLATTN